VAPSTARAGPFDLIKQLSSGGSGEVWVARRAGAEGEGRVAVKWMLPYLAGEPELVTRFLDEVRLLARLRHPNIVSIIDVGMSDGRPWLAMELVEGVSLYTLLERCRQRNELLPLTVVRRIAQGLLDALSYAHTLEGLQVIHRDVSPSNVLVSATGEVRLSDFGLARASTNWAKTHPGGLGALKLGYTAPEVERGGAAVDQRADVFGAGVTLFEALTLQQPFRRPGMSDVDTLGALGRGDALNPLTARAELGPEMAAALLRAVRPSPAERFASAAELRAAFMDGELATPDAVGAWVKRLCPEELARFFSVDDVPPEQLDAPTVTFTVGGPVTQATQLTRPAEELAAGVRRRGLRLGLVAAVVLGAAALLGLRLLQKPAPVPVAPVAAPQPPVLEPKPVDVAAETVDAGTTLEVPKDVELSPHEPMGTLSTEGEPGVPVLLDGKPLGLTPLNHVEVPAGKHVVIFKLKHGEVRKKIMLIEGKPMTVRSKH
jgi:serine/threonine-protein kinase